MKKIITSVIILLLLFCFTSLASETSSLKVSVTDFAYSANTLPAGGSLGVSCKLKQIFDENQEYTFLVLVTKNGAYSSHYQTSGTLMNKIPADISGTVSIPSDTTGVLVETFVWDSLKSGKALASGGIFSGAVASENSLEKLYVDGKEIEIKDNMTLDYNSISHTPNISPIAKDSSAKVEVDAITSIPQDVNIKVTAQNGDVKNYVLSLKLPEGKITDAYQLDNSNAKITMGINDAKKPQYKEGEDPTVDSTIAYNTVLPTSATQIFVDRAISTSGRFYLVDIPDSLIGKKVIQPNLSLFNNAAIHQDKTKGNAETGFFTIDRSADVYVYDVHDATDWIVTQGYEKLDSSYNTSIIRNTAATQPKTAYRKRFVVEEGATKTITLGGATSADGKKDTYYLIVDFLKPTTFVAAKSVYINGVGNVEIKEDVYEYDFVVMEDITPSFEWELLGIGAKSSTPVITTSENGKTATVVLTSKDNSSSLTYKFNFVDFSKALEEIKVDGTLVDGFDKNTKNYTYELPFGVTEPKEVTASVIDHPYIELSVAQATESNPVAKVTIKNTETEEEIVYTVTFKMSNKTTITPTISYMGSNAKCSQSSGNTAAFRFMLSTVDNQITTNFLKLDISSLKEIEYINENTRFILNLNAKMQRTLSDTSKTSDMDSVTVNVYSLPESFDWDTEVTTRISNNYSGYAGSGDGTDYKTYVAGKTPVATGSHSFNNISGKNDFHMISLDISSIVSAALERDDDYAYMVFGGDAAQKDQLSSKNVKYLVFYYYIASQNAPTLTIEIND